MNCEADFMLVKDFRTIPFRTIKICSNLFFLVLKNVKYNSGKMGWGHFFVEFFVCTMLPKAKIETCISKQTQGVRVSQMLLTGSDRYRPRLSSSGSSHIVLAVSMTLQHSTWWFPIVQAGWRLHAASESAPASHTIRRQVTPPPPTHVVTLSMATVAPLRARLVACMTRHVARKEIGG